MGCKKKIIISLFNKWFIRVIQSYNFVRASFGAETYYLKYHLKMTKFNTISALTQAIYFSHFYNSDHSIKMIRG